MIPSLTILFILLFVPWSFSYAFAIVDSVETDKSVYYDGDTIHVSGIVSSELPVTSVSVVILDPTRSTFVAVAPTIANSDGSFSVIIRAGGPLWTSYGLYPIQATSEDTTQETIIEYMESSTPEPEPTPEPTPEPIATFNTLKLQVPNFPALDQPPQYYIDRYDNEPSYKIWFDSQFPNYSIHNILGYDDPVSVPDWVRNNAEWWATGKINDTAFISGIEFMLENNIIMVSTTSSGNLSDEDIPGWIKNNAHWWSQDLISEDEFVNALKFMIQEGIIIIN